MQLTEGKALGMEREDGEDLALSASEQQSYSIEVDLDGAQES